jgi:hypothetical protein
MRFVELDASTEGKDPGLLLWLRDVLAVHRSNPALGQARRLAHGRALRLGLDGAATRA